LLALTTLVIKIRENTLVTPALVQRGGLITDGVHSFPAFCSKCAAWALAAGKCHAATLILGAGLALAQQPSQKPSAPEALTPVVHEQETSSSAPKHHWAELKWKASPEKHVVGYNVYRAEGSASANAKLITPHPVKGTEYRDNQVEAGKTYFYTITTVQKIKSRLVESQPAALVKARIPSP
jgi:hypothetical protein